MTHIPTMKIASDETEYGYIIINEADFDPSTMERYEESEASGDAADSPDATAGETPLPSVAKLADALAAIADADAIRAMQARDTRKSAAPLYEARLAALIVSASE